MTLYQVAEELSRRLASIFLRDAKGGARSTAATRKFQDDPHWRDLHPVLRVLPRRQRRGLGASHQTGWTGIVARAMHLFATTTPEQVLELGKAAGVTETAQRAAGRSGARRSR